jgi:phosphatidate phosphatase APP1
LRDTTDLDDFIPNKEITVKHKKETIERLFSVYSKRKFILVGDSGESDPEIYADLQRKYPDRVLLHYHSQCNRWGRKVVKI